MGLTRNKELLKDAVEGLLGEEMFSITGGGLVPLQNKIMIQPNVQYHMGASSSPSKIFVTKVTKDAIHYLNYPYYKQQERRMQLGIAQDMISRGVSTFLKSGYVKYPWGKKLAKRYRDLMAGKKVKPEKLSDFDRIRVFVSPGEGYAKQDLWRDAEQYGSVAGRRIDGKTDGFHWAKDDYSMLYVIETIKKDLAAIKKDKRFKIEKVEAE